jgi:hypothetical protein
MFKAMALRGYTLHTPTGFLIFNKGAETDNIGDEYRDVLVRDGVIADDGAAAADEPVALAGKNKAQLLDIAEAEGVEVPEGATNATIVEAIEAKRAAAPDAGAPTE